MTKFIVYGHSGWIGSQVVKLLEQLNITHVRGQSRVSDKENLEREIMNTKPTHVLCLIGRTSGKIGETEYTTIDYLEQPGKIKENVRDNLFSPLVLALLSVKHNFHLTYLGTGCIFEYDEQHPFGKSISGFTENDKPNFFGSSYSVVKGYTDELMHMFNETILNVRIRMPITADYNKKNFIKKIITYQKICSVPNSMTVLPDLLPIMIDMATRNITGTINLTNPGVISHNEILEMYRDIIDPSFVWVNFSIDEQKKILASQRSNNYLETNKLQNMYPHIKDIKTSVRDVLCTIARETQCMEK